MMHGTELHASTFDGLRGPELHAHTRGISNTINAVCTYVCLSNQNIHALVRFKFAVPMCPFGLPPQIARFLWCMIRLDLCHGKSVKRLAAYISEYARRTEVAALMHTTIDKSVPTKLYSLRLITGRAKCINQTTATSR